MNKYEKETIIRFNESEKFANIYTCSKPQMNKYDKFCKLYPDDYKLENETACSKTYQVDKKLITGGRAPIKRKKMSEEEKKVFKERMKKR